MNIHEETLEIARSLIHKDPSLKDWVVSKFPELKEVEDEMIRKEIIQSIQDNMCVIHKDKCIAWLEKQKEVVEEYEDKLDRCACESFDKGYKAATEKIDAIENFDTEFEKQVSHLIASAINKEHEYNQSYVKWTANALLNYAKHELEKQGEQSIYDVPSRNMILAVWELGNEWKELTNGSISKEYGTQLEYIQKHWNESQYYLRDKQGEQKPDDKIKSKFKIGDWIINPKGTIAHVNDVKKDFYGTLRYYVEFSNGNKSDPMPCFVDCKYHLWTIQDAKDGDVLATKDIVFIFKHMDKTGLSLCKSYCEVIGNSKLGLGFDFSINDVHPATKEQRDTLERAMTNAGYRWNKEELKLEKI